MPRPIRRRAFVVACLLAATLPTHGQGIISFAGDTPTLAPTPPSGTGLIMGRVVEGDTNKPVAGVIVNLYLTPVGSYDPVITDDEGRFVFREIPKGDFTLRTSKPGWQYGAYGKRYPTGPEETGQLLALGDDERASGVTIKMWKYAVVTGMVTDETGDPIIGATVRALPRRTIAGRSMFSMEIVAGFTGTTDDRGVFRLAQLPPGDDDHDDGGTPGYKLTRH